MKIYAGLIGNWVCLNDDPDCKIGEDGKSPNAWYGANGPVYAPENRKPDSYCELDYVHILYKGIDYRINPIFIQAVEG